MADACHDDVLYEIAELVGMEAISIRKTNELPPRVSVIDVASVETGHDAHYAGETVRKIRMIIQHSTTCGNLHPLT